MVNSLQDDDRRGVELHGVVAGDLGAAIRGGGHGVDWNRFGRDGLGSDGFGRRRRGGLVGGTGFATAGGKGQHAGGREEGESCVHRCNSF